MSEYMLPLNNILEDITFSAVWFNSGWVYRAYNFRIQNLAPPSYDNFRRKLTTGAHMCQLRVCFKLDLETYCQHFSELNKLAVFYFVFHQFKI